MDGGAGRRRRRWRKNWKEICRGSLGRYPTQTSRSISLRLGVTPSQRRLADPHRIHRIRILHRILRTLVTRTTPRTHTGPRRHTIASRPTGLSRHAEVARARLLLSGVPLSILVNHRAPLLGRLLTARSMMVIQSERRWIQLSVWKNCES